MRVPVLVVLSMFLSAQSCGPQVLLKLAASHTSGVVHPPGDGPPFVELLEAQMPSWDHRNVAEGGTAAANWRDGAAPFNGEVLHDTRLVPNAPAVVMVSDLGPNDATISFVLFGSDEQAAVTWFDDQLTALLGDMLALGYVVILATPPPFPTGDGRQARLEAMVDVVRDTCSTHGSGVACGPDLFEVVDRDLHFEGGNQHMNAEGHQAVADAWLDYFESNGFAL